MKVDEKSEEVVLSFVDTNLQKVMSARREELETLSEAMKGKEQARAVVFTAQRACPRCLYASGQVTCKYTRESCM